MKRCCSEDATGRRRLEKDQERPTSDMESKESEGIQDPEAHQAQLVPRGRPLHQARIRLDRGAHKGRRGPQDFQGEMDSREAKVTKEIQVREGFQDTRVWLEKLEPKERREIQELDCQAPLASPDLLDPPDHAVYRTEQMPWVLDLKTSMLTMNSSGVLLVHLGPQDHRGSLDTTCHQLTLQRVFPLAMLDHLVLLEKTGHRADLEYQVHQEKMELQVCQGLLDGRVIQVYLGHLDQRANVAL